ncbi:MAG TPA: type I DNA topoisomerase [Clostridiales bacterium]|nr:type I DNA topoisomerase [Clostridiales bacterium]
MKLLIIESAGKVDTIKKYLGKDWEVFATGGHIRDLPEKSLGVDIKNGFEPKYENREDKLNTINRLKEKAKKADEIYIATDPDREGEAIGWHVATILGLDMSKKNRVEFNSITKEVILSEIAKPRCLDKDMFDAQQARRVLDRLVGYKISPILCKKIANRLSAGRVQSVALKLVVDREREILNFVPEEYWSLGAKLQKENLKPKFKANLNTITNKKIKLNNKGMMDRVLNHLKDGDWLVKSVKKTVSKSHAPAPFTTSSMQQDAINKLGMSLKQVTACAQELYEGVELGKDGKIALVTYIRTDSVRVSDEARINAKKYIIEKFGSDYYPAKPNVYKSKGENVQDAHEAIRPAHFEISPESVKQYLSPSNYKLYKLIYERFFASQMAEATYNSVVAEIECNDCQFKVTGKTPKFPGYTAIYQDYKKQDEEEQTEAKLPELTVGDRLNLLELLPEQKFTKPLPRYTESTLIKAMEENGIGRPATYTPTITILSTRKYVEKEGKSLKPTQLGFDVTDLLQKYFSPIINVDFTAVMEDKLDQIATKKEDWHNIISSFYDMFLPQLKVANGDSSSFVEKEAPVVSDVVCDKCGAMMVIKNGKFGKFLACPNYPKCKNIKKLQEKSKVVSKCPKCGKNVLEKISKKGKLYYACEDYTDCKFISWDLPLDEKCPQCDCHLVQHETKNNIIKHCSNESCDYKQIIKKQVQNTETKSASNAVSGENYD